MYTHTYTESTALERRDLHAAAQESLPLHRGRTCPPWSALDSGLRRVFGFGVWGSSSYQEPPFTFKYEYMVPHSGYLGLNGGSLEGLGDMTLT